MTLTTKPLGAPNNCYRDYAVQNAAELRDLLSR